MLLPSFSVVTCTLGRLETLQDMITSLLAQDVLPLEFILVDGSNNRESFAGVERQLGAAQVPLVYLSSRPSLVIQRNIGAAHAAGNVIFMLDDDLILKPGFTRSILEAYAADSTGEIGGVQGTIDNLIPDPPLKYAFRRLFGLVRLDDGRLQRSGRPAFLIKCSAPTSIQIFFGCVMTFRREVLEQISFDEHLADFWMGDDFDFSFRVSQHYRLVQVPGARATHLGGATAVRDKAKIRRNWRMATVNHLYIFRKYRSSEKINWLFYLWAEVGQVLVALARAAFVDRGAAFLGMLDGYADLLHGGPKVSKPALDSQSTVSGR